MGGSRIGTSRRSRPGVPAPIEPAPQPLSFAGQALARPGSMNRVKGAFGGLGLGTDNQVTGLVLPLPTTEPAEKTHGSPTTPAKPSHHRDHREHRVFHHKDPKTQRGISQLGTWFSSCLRFLVVAKISVTSVSSQFFLTGVGRKAIDAGSLAFRGRLQSDPEEHGGFTGWIRGERQGVNPGSQRRAHRLCLGLTDPGSML